MSYTWVKSCLQTAGLVPRRRRRGPHRLRRPRRPLPGMLLQLDGSEHAWNPGLLGHQTLLALLDDATHEVYAAILVPEEATRAVLALLRSVVEAQGVFCSLYTDRASLFVTTRYAGTPHRPQQARQPTQVERALRELGIQLILTHSPQAKGRIERLCGTWQGRLPQELRLHGLITYTDANSYLHHHFLPLHNRHLPVPAAQAGSTFLPCPRPDLERVFALQHTRTVAPDNTVQFGRAVFQLHRALWRVSFAKCRVTVYEHLDGTISIGLGPHTLGRYDARGHLLPPHGNPLSARKRKHRIDHVLRKADNFTC